MILALDQSNSRTGWACGEPAGPVECGSYANISAKTAEGDDFGLALVSYRRWLSQMLLEREPERLVFEQPAAPFGKTHLYTARLLYGLAGVIEMTCRDLDVPAYEVKNNTHRLHTFGKGYGGSKKIPESVVRRKVGDWGVAVDNHDEGMAASVFLTHVSVHYPEIYAGAWLTRRAQGNEAA